MFPSVVLCISVGEDREGGGYAVYALLPKKDERYRRRGIKVEPQWLAMGECVIFRTLELKFLGRSHYKKLFHQNHMLLYLVKKKFVSFKQSTSLSIEKSLLSASISDRVGLRKYLLRILTYFLHSSSRCFTVIVTLHLSHSGGSV